MLHEVVMDGLVPGDGDIFFSEHSRHLRQFEVYDRAEDFIAEGSIDDDVVDTIDEFRTQVISELPYHHIVQCFHLDIVDIMSTFLLAKEIHNLLRTNVAGHDDNGISKVDSSSFTICESTIIENLKKDIVDIGMSFFYLVKEQN